MYVFCIKLAARAHFLYHSTVNVSIALAKNSHQITEPLWFYISLKTFHNITLLCAFIEKFFCRTNATPF